MSTVVFAPVQKTNIHIMHLKDNFQTNSHKPIGDLMSAKGFPSPDRAKGHIIIILRITIYRTP